MDDRFDDHSTLPTDRMARAYLDEAFETADLPLDYDDPIQSEDADTSLLRAQCVTATLPIGAPEAFELFCDASTAPEWVSVVKSVSVLSRTGDGRPERVAFLARLQGASIGYTVTYEYGDNPMTARWSTAAGSITRVVGGVTFRPLGSNACLMEYKLLLDLPGAALPSWDDPAFNDNAASAVVCEFRDFINRRRHR